MTFNIFKVALNIFFDIIEISETRIIKQVYSSNNLNLNYCFKFTITETSIGTLLIIATNCL